MGDTGVGKSLVLCHFAASFVRSGYNVLYITFEMPSHEIAERIDANLLDVPLHGLDPTRTYRLADVRTGVALGVRSGAELEAGLRVALPPFTAQVIAVDSR